MRRFAADLILVLAFFSSCTLAQDQRYSISLSGTYTSSSKLYFAPNNPDDFIRSRNYPIENIFGFGMDVRRSFEDLGVWAGIGVEWLSKTEAIEQPVNSTTTAPIYDGYAVVPVELTGYFIVPFSSEAVQLYMGGGAGAYLGERRYQQAGVNAAVTARSAGFGIHVLSGLQYNFQSSLSLRCEAKFRNVQFRSTNAFDRPVGFAAGHSVRLDQTPFESRISIDGMVTSLGLVYRF